MLKSKKVPPSPESNVCLFEFSHFCIFLFKKYNFRDFCPWIFVFLCFTFKFIFFFILHACSDGLNCPAKLVSTLTHARAASPLFIFQWFIRRCLVRCTHHPPKTMFQWNQELTLCDLTRDAVGVACCTGSGCGRGDTPRGAVGQVGGSLVDLLYCVRVRVVARYGLAGRLQRDESCTLSPVLTHAARELFAQGNNFCSFVKAISTWFQQVRERNQGCVALTVWW